jgi:hypothetical protein
MTKLNTNHLVLAMDELDDTAERLDLRVFPEAVVLRCDSAVCLNRGCFDR